MTRRLYNLEDGEGGLRIADAGARPRRWQLVHAVSDDRFVLGLVVGQDEEARPLVERMVGHEYCYPMTGRTVWYRGATAERRRLGLPDPRRWWRSYERTAENDRAVGWLTTVLIDGARCRVLAHSADFRFLVTAALNRGDKSRVAAQQERAAARIIVLNAELKSRRTPVHIPIPVGSESLQIFGEVAPWKIAVPDDESTSDSTDAKSRVPRVYRHVAIYQASIPLAAHIWRAGPRGGRLIGFEYGHTRVIDGVVAWTGRLEEAIRVVAAEYQRRYWLEYANYIGGD
jgi:hypothetical protein